MLPTECIKTSKKPHLRPARLYVHRIKNQRQRLHKALYYAPLFYAFLLWFPFTNLQYFLMHLSHFLFNPLWLVYLSFLWECRFWFTYFLFTPTFFFRDMTKALNKAIEWAIWKILLSDNVSIIPTTCGRMSFAVFIGYLKVSELLKYLNKFVIHTLRDRRNKTFLY